MLRTSTALQYRSGTLALVDAAIVEADAERAMDEVLADSFPASDPPSWNPGTARPNPVGHLLKWNRGDVTAAGEEADVIRTGIIDVSRPAQKRTVIRGLLSLAGASGLVLLVPFAILLVGLPIVLFVRGLAEAAGWLIALISP